MATIGRVSIFGRCGIFKDPQEYLEHLRFSRSYHVQLRTEIRNEGSIPADSPDQEHSDSISAYYVSGVLQSLDILGTINYYTNELGFRLLDLKPNKVPPEDDVDAWASSWLSNNPEAPPSSLSPEGKSGGGSGSGSGTSSEDGDGARQAEMILAYVASIHRSPPDYEHCDLQASPWCRLRFNQVWDPRLFTPSRALVALPRGRQLEEVYGRVRDGLAIHGELSTDWDLGYNYFAVFDTDCNLVIFYRFFTHLGGDGQ